jgi:SAM-dependent methyltransferase
MTFVSTKTGQFAYFSQQVGDADWRGKNVLDYGGNIGNILRDPSCTIDEERYWCVDVDAESIARGRAFYPRANWVHFDRWCFFFNPYGVRGLALPKIDRQFDYIVAYSVFTNTPPSDMLDLVGDLESRLAPGGALAFTFIDHRYHAWPSKKYKWNNFHWRLEREQGDVWTDEATELRARADASAWCILVNGEELYVEREDVRDVPPEEQRTYHVFYAAEQMKAFFPHAEIVPPANNEMQHCCVIRKR